MTPGPSHFHHELGALALAFALARNAGGGRQEAAAATSSRPWARAFQLKVAHLIRTGNFTTPWRAASSPSLSRSISSGSPDMTSAPEAPSSSGPRLASWIDIIPLKVEISRRTSSTGLPLTAADIKEA